MAKAPSRSTKPRASAKASPAPGAIALIADRRVEEPDIRRAALVMENDPLRTRQHALWRKKLLDLCVDRELLALEAERAGIPNDPSVKRRIEQESAGILYAAIRERFLVQELTPNAAQIDTARAGGLFRRVKVAYILSLTDRKTTYAVYEALRNGANFDSVAALYSVHPSASKGGEIGWKRIGALNAQSWTDFKSAKPGDLLGPYSNDVAHELYRVEAIEDPDDKELREAILRDRTVELDSRYSVGLLRKYRFQLDPEEISSIIFAAATEKADSILASLDSEGRRPKRGVRPGLGVIARLDGDSITYRDIGIPELLVREADGKAHIEDSRELLSVCTAAVLPRLIARDARDRGLDKDHVLARRVRLIREEVSTHAMVARAVPPPDMAAIQAYFDSHRARYRRPAARRALVAMFASEDTARMARAGWDRATFRDSVIALEGFRKTEPLFASNVWPRCYAEMPFFETDQDSLSIGVGALREGEISPVLRTPNGYAVAKAMGAEPARGFTFEEVSRSVAIDAREDAENAWVVAQLERLRAATPVRTVPARLEAVRLGMSSDMGGKRR